MAIRHIKVIGHIKVIRRIKLIERIKVGHRIVIERITLINTEVGQQLIRLELVEPTKSFKS